MPELHPREILANNNNIILYLYTLYSILSSVIKPANLAPLHSLKNKSSRITHFHISKINTATSKRTRSKGTEGGFGSGRHGFFVFFELAGDVADEKFSWIDMRRGVIGWEKLCVRVCPDVGFPVRGVSLSTDCDTL